MLISYIISEQGLLLILTIPIQLGGSWPSSSFVLRCPESNPDLFPLKNQGHTAVDRGHGRIGLGGQYNEVFPVLISAIKSSQEQYPAPFLSE